MLCGPSPSPLPSSEGSRHTRHVTRTGKLDEEKGGMGKSGAQQATRTRDSWNWAARGSVEEGGRASESSHGVRSCPVPRTADQNPSTALAQLVT